MVLALFTFSEKMVLEFPKENCYNKIQLIEMHSFYSRDICQFEWQEANVERRPLFGEKHWKQNYARL